MTHFVLVVAADDPDDVPELMEPFNENIEVPDRPQYLTDWRWEYQRELAEIAAHPERTRRGVDYDNPAEVLEYMWGERVYQDDQGEFYVMSTVNPNAKWDLWSIGGRYGGFFRLATTVPPDLPDDLEHTAYEDGAVNGAPKRFLDLEGMRSEAADRAGRAWDAFEAVRSQHPQAKGWSAFHERFRANPIAYPITQARNDYWDQPLVREPLPEDVRSSPCPIDRFNTSRSVHTRRAYDRGPLGFALLTREGEWMAPGRMGWFATTDATQADWETYATKANAYIDALSGDTYLIAVDCHI
ncbi:hypothetical protein J4H86_12835 [Spiractinospora alimapuensis]|uniref:hypothetical protein n=1 Tax=Spiractinospora alimapuensis TaxID=2820884 RepID=UPI001F24F1E3|nr:hypothetical protein [Spiractinospora alimapuensis]QVQ54468.1 hypothetical protein J4H86_12835 [Spiractinospora alimapuensis]